VLWPFLWIWATLWREDRGWGMQQLNAEQHDLHQRLDAMQAELNRLKNSAVNQEGK
jgi:Protein of unknown function (DUF3302).